jgi:hypothetical protein
MFIRFTYIDSVTGIPVTTEASKHGPKNPDIPGLQFGFALESQYPTEQPIFYGTCDDGVPGTTHGILEVLTQVQYIEARAAEMSTRVTIARNKKYDDLKLARQKSEAKGVGFSGHLGTQVLQGTLYFPAEKDDQDRVNAALTNMERYPSIQSVQFKAAPGLFMTLNYEELKLVGFQMATHVQQCFAVESQHSVNISRMKTVDEINAYDVTTGWPS